MCGRIQESQSIPWIGSSNHMNAEDTPISPFSHIDPVFLNCIYLLFFSQLVYFFHLFVFPKKKKIFFIFFCGEPFEQVSQILSHNQHKNKQRWEGEKGDTDLGILSISQTLIFLISLPFKFFFFSFAQVYFLNKNLASQHEWCYYIGGL